MKREKLSTRELCMAAIFAVLTAVCAQIIVPLPFTPIFISFGMVGVYIAAIMLPPRCAVMSQVCYLLLGAVGLPVFGGFRGGVGVLFGLTGGYLLVYPLIVFIVSYTLNSRRALNSETSKRAVFAKGTVAVCAAHMVLYLAGTVWLCAISGNTFVAGLSMAVFPFVPMDIVKIIFCCAVIIPIRMRFMRAGLLLRPAQVLKKEEAKQEI